MERFVPSYYAKDLYEYFKEMEIFMTRAQIEESQEATLARFLHRLNREIQGIVELHHYSTLDDLVHQATKRKFSSKKSYHNTSWKGKEREKERLRRDKSPKNGNDFSQGPPPTSSASKSSSIKCFKFLGERAHCILMP
ncbi:hypothetical protein CR513_37536, partial [Mucuna pruriens]